MSPGGPDRPLIVRHLFALTEAVESVLVHQVLTTKLSDFAVFAGHVETFLDALQLGHRAR